MNPRGRKVIQKPYFSHLSHTKQLSLVPFCNASAEIGAEQKCDARRTDGQTDGQMDGLMEGQTDLKSEIVIWF